MKKKKVIESFSEFICELVTIQSHLLIMNISKNYLNSFKTRVGET
jgi:hypothetical protein